jgi:hypothetical protein
MTNCLLCLMKDQVPSENSHLGYDLLTISQAKFMVFLMELTSPAKQGTFRKCFSVYQHAFLLSTVMNAK